MALYARESQPILLPLVASFLTLDRTNTPIYALCGESLRYQMERSLERSDRSPFFDVLYSNLLNVETTKGETIIPSINLQNWILLSWLNFLYVNVSSDDDNVVPE